MGVHDIHFGSQFRLAAGRLHNLRIFADQLGRRWLIQDFLGVSQAGNQPIHSISQIMVHGMERFAVISTIFSASGKMISITNTPVSLKTTRVFAAQKI